MVQNTTKNVTANIAQILISALVLFVIYGYVSRILGVALLGVWSVVLATASATRLADLGLSAGVTRFISKYSALNQNAKAAEIMETALVSIAVILGLILLIIYPILVTLVKYVFNTVDSEEALKILPYALLSVWLAMIVSVMQNGLDGCHLIIKKAVIIVIGQIALLIFVLGLVQKQELVGLAVAQIAQGVLMIILCWGQLRKKLTSLPMIPYKINKSCLKEIFNFGVQVQVGNLSIVLIEPLTKVMIAKYGSSEAAGLFEIANQIVLRVRTVFGAANQTLVPLVAHYSVSKSEILKNLYTKNLRLIVVPSIFCYLILDNSNWLISNIFLSKPSQEFNLMLELMIICWFINTLAGPAYVFNLGIGSVKHNTIGYLIIGLINLILGACLGIYFGGMGVIIAYSIAICTGSLYILLNYHHRHCISINKIIKENLILGVISILIVLITRSNFSEQINEYYHWMAYILTVIIILFVLYFVYIHKMSKIILRILRLKRSI
jgi:O-antigen/teichoic acid export membrane protein